VDGSGNLTAEAVDISKHGRVSPRGDPTAFVALLPKKAAPLTG
jgi:hypothetical protein